MKLTGVVGIVFGLLMLMGHEATAGAPLTQADKDWLRQECHDKRTAEDCSVAGKQLRDQGKQVTFDDLLAALPPQQEEKPWQRYKKPETSAMADKEWLRSRCSWQHTREECRSGMKVLADRGKAITPEDVQEAIGDSPTISEATEFCVKTVKGVNPGSQFDAYVHGDSIRTFGIPYDEFQFQKCMHNLGHTLGKGERPSEPRP